jgi:hypothetical protein
MGRNSERLIVEIYPALTSALNSRVCTIMYVLENKAGKLPRPKLVLDSIVLDQHIYNSTAVSITAASVCVNDRELNGRIF